ncbi:MAG TPA: CDP-glycerol glycerophosphotransferase family protein [Niallia sp.]|nr:CDP-glycerol glycerophosphotransferase family protein [Niallia sp.]
MARELAIYLYLKLFSFLFIIAKLFPMQKKIVFCVSFIENNMYIYQELKKQSSTSCIILADNRTYSFFQDKVHDGDKVIQFIPKKPISFIKSIYHLATSPAIVLDNYFGFLSAVQFKEGVKKLQIWHANGAIKTFGWKDASVEKRSEQSKKRFAKVYSQFDYIISGSETMSQIFQEAFSISKEKIIHTGIPRTDIFFDKQYIESTKEKLYKKYAIFKHKKIILYAPTFRENEEDISEVFPLNISYLKQKLGSDYILLIKLHPSINKKMNINQYDGFVYDFSDYALINDLLFISDILITDYSSIPFEYSFLQKPMIFYPYDLEEYTRTRGFWTDYDSLVPGPVAYNTEDIVENIINSSFNMEQLDYFHQKWNTYSIGESSKNVVAFILDMIDKEK